MQKKTLVAISIASIASSLTLNADTTPAQVVEETPFDADAYVAMGFAMASQLRLNIGFSEEEMEAIFKGMKLAASGESEPEDFSSAVQRAQQAYMTKMQAFQKIEQERAMKLAEENKAKGAEFFATLDANPSVKKTESGLYYEVIEEGEGDSPAASDKVIVNYKGTLIDGTQFDANDGAEFSVGRLVPGFTEGLQLMKPGGSYKLYIPSELGYGDAPARPGSPITPGSTLVFSVDLVEVKKTPTPPIGTPPTLPPNLPKPPPPPSGPPPGAPPGPPPNMPPPAPPSGN